VRFVTWRDNHGLPHPGAVVDNHVVDLSDLAPDVTAILAGGANLAAEVAAKVSHANLDDAPILNRVSLAAPVNPSKILCLGYNYAGHVAKGQPPQAQPEFPNVFCKTPNTIAGPDDVVPLPSVSQHTDYEGEIGIVISKQGKDIPLAEAADYIGGYTLVNDVSSRDWQDRSSQWELGKCFDKFCPFGPWIVTPDEIPNPERLTVEVVRDGVVTVSQSTADLVFPFPFIVHYLSQVMTLEPGDLIVTGSPQKLPEALANHRPLSDGDEVTVRVAGLGELTTKFAGRGRCGGPDN